MILLKNDYIRVEIDPTGGRLAGIRTIDNDLEYLWQKSKFPNMFPFVGRLFDKRYLYQGDSYPMEMHGFLRYMQMQIASQSEAACTLELSATEDTKKCYPFDFLVRISYQLQGSSVQISFEVENHTLETLYCAVGGHPGFNVPLESGLAFEDYALVFPEICHPEMVEFSDAVLTTEARTPYPLENGVKIPLKHELFARDALVLQGTPGCVEIVAERGTHGVRVDYPKMPYVGFWQFDKGEPQFVCVEPWTALPGRQDVIEDICTMPDLMCIAPEECYQNTWAITVW